VRVIREECPDDAIAFWMAYRSLAISGAWDAAESATRPGTEAYAVRCYLFRYRHWVGAEAYYGRRYPPVVPWWLDPDE
jgi:hypothetical protein